MAWFAAIAQGIASAGKAMGNYAALQQSARTADLNAQVLRMQAADVFARSAAEVGAVRHAKSAGEGRLVAAAAAAGIDTTSGSPAVAVTAGNIAAERDIARVRANAARQAWGFKFEASQLKQEAKQLRKKSILGFFGVDAPSGGMEAYSAYRQAGGGGK